MKTNKKLLSTFVGGNLQIQGKEDGFLYEGKISALVIAGSKVHVAFEWLAKLKQKSETNNWTFETSRKKVTIELGKRRKRYKLLDYGDRACLAHSADRNKNFLFMSNSQDCLKFKDVAIPKGGSV